MKLKPEEQLVRENSYQRKYSLATDQELYNESLRVGAGGVFSDPAEAEIFALELQRRKHKSFEVTREALKKNDYSRPWKFMMDQNIFKLQEGIAKRPKGQAVSLLESKINKGAASYFYVDMKDFIKIPDFSAQAQEMRQNRIMRSIQNRAAAMKRNH